MVTRCSREALTVEPPAGASRGRRPAYVPTTSARVRSPPIVSLTVASRRSTSQPAALGRPGEPSNGASVVPMSQKSGQGTRKTICGTRTDIPTVDGMRVRGTTRWAPRLGRIPIDDPPKGWPGAADHTPVASTTVVARMARSAPVSPSRASSDARRPVPLQLVARTRVTATGDAASARAVRTTASV